MCVDFSVGFPDFCVDFALISPSKGSIQKRIVRRGAFGRIIRELDDMAPGLVFTLVCQRVGAAFFECGKAHIIVRYDKRFRLIWLIHKGADKDLDRYAHLAERIVIRIAETFETVKFTEHKASLIFKGLEFFNACNYPSGIDEAHIFRALQCIQENLIA